MRRISNPTSGKVFLPVWMHLLNAMATSNTDVMTCSNVTRNGICVYSHTYHLLVEMEKEGLIKSTKDGKERLYKLTTHGEKIAENVKPLVRLFHQRLGVLPEERMGGAGGV